MPTPSRELVLCGLLIASRNVVEGVEWAKTLIGEGDKIPALVEKGKNQFVGPELLGKTLGVIGLGAVGVLVANAAASIGMNVVGYDPYISIDNAWHLSDTIHKAAKMEDLLAQADYITVHVPLIEQTKDYLSSPEFGKMKDGVVVLNFARGGIIRETSLFEALDSGKVAKIHHGFPGRPLPDAHEKVICIPHLGASTPESERNCAIMAANEIKHYLERGQHQELGEHAKLPAR